MPRPNLMFWVLAAAGVFGAFWTGGASRLDLQVLGVGFLVVLLVVLPLQLSRQDLHQRPVWVISALSLVISFGLRSIASAANGEWRTFFYEKVDAFSAPTLVYAVGSVLALTWGYHLGGLSSQSLFRRAVQRVSHAERSEGWIIVALFTILISLLATSTFISLTGGFSWSNISAKRGVFTNEEAQGSSSLFMLRIFAELPLAYCLVLFGAQRQVIQLRRISHSLVAVAMVLSGMSLAVVASEREVLVSFFGLMVLLLLVRSPGTGFFKALAVGCVALLALGAVSSFRASGEDDLGSVVSLDTAYVAIEASLVNRNLADQSKTLRIVEAIPDTFEFDLGYRQFGSIVGIVPRFLWESKPVIGSGPEVSDALYGNSASGIPPGLIAESYWSFGPFGLLAVGIFGALLGQADLAIRRQAALSGYSLFLLASLGLDALGVGFGFALTSLFVRFCQLALIGLLLHLLRASRVLNPT